MTGANIRTFSTLLEVLIEATSLHDLEVFRTGVVAATHHRLQLRARYHGVGELHLLGQHGHVFLLNEVVPAVDLQLGL